MLSKVNGDLNLNPFRTIEITSQLLYYPQRTMQPYSPYAIRTPFSASSQPNLFNSQRQQTEPAPTNNRQKSYLLKKVQALLPYLA